MHTVKRNASIINVPKVHIIFTICVVLLLVIDITAVKWLSVYRGKQLLWNNTKTCKDIRKQYGLTGQQTKLCRKSSDIMPHVQEAANLVVSTCEILFRTRLWNCSSLKQLPKLLPDLEIDTKERAAVHALSTAALTYTVSRGCSQSSINSCGCSSHPEEPPNGNFKWGGCGDNVQWGSRFSKMFIDFKKKNKDKRTSKNLKYVEYQDRDKTTNDDDNDVLDQSYNLVAQINNFNGEIGRKVVSNSLITHCKCHGVSGSCSIKTCWRGLPLKFSEIGEKVMSAYNRAVQVHTLSNAHVIARYSEEQCLLYTANSPNYCENNPQDGTYGTSGRECNNSLNAAENCDNMCCGRGYKSCVVEYIERCNCQYHWCCYVTCEKCKVKKTINICN